MSNRRKISLAKLAEQLTGVRPGTARAEPARPGRPAFPRIPAERFEELLDNALCVCRGGYEGTGCEGGPECLDDEGGVLPVHAGRLRFRAMLDDHAAPIGTNPGLHYQGRPQ